MCVRVFLAWGVDEQSWNVENWIVTVDFASCISGANRNFHQRPDMSCLDYKEPGQSERVGSAVVCPCHWDSVRYVCFIWLGIHLITIWVQIYCHHGCVWRLPASFSCVTTTSKIDSENNVAGRFQSWTYFFFCFASRLLHLMNTDASEQVVWGRWLV